MSLFFLPLHHTSFQQQTQIYKLSRKHQDSFPVTGSPARSYQTKPAANYEIEKLLSGPPAQSHDLRLLHGRPESALLAESPELLVSASQIHLTPIQPTTHPSAASRKHNCKLKLGSTSRLYSCHLAPLPLPTLF